MIFLATAGLAEFYGLVERRNLVCFKWCGLLGGVLLMVGTFLQLTGEISALATGCVHLMIRQPGPMTLKRVSSSCLSLGHCLRQFVSRGIAPGILAILATLFGLMYVPSAVELHPENQFFPRRGGPFLRPVLHHRDEIKRHRRLCCRLAHRPSGGNDSAHQPGKTWEGFGGAIFLRQWPASSSSF